MSDRGTTEPIPTCQLCGEPMPEDEEMFNYHGYSGPCPKPQTASLSAPSAPQTEPVRELVEALKECYVDLGGLLQAATWELAPAVRAQLQKTHDLTGRVLARYQK